MAKNTEKNALASNKAARRKYIRKNYKTITINLKNEELEKVDAYCKANNESRGGLAKKLLLDKIENNI